MLVPPGGSAPPPTGNPGSAHGIQVMRCTQSWTNFFLFHAVFGKKIAKQEWVKVECVPPACWPYLPACTASGGYLVPGGVYLIWGVYLVRGAVPGLRGVPGPEGVYLVWGSVPGLGVSWSRGCTWYGGVCLVPGGVHLVWGVPGPRGVYLVPSGGTCPGPPHPREQNDRQV